MTDGQIHTQCECTLAGHCNRHNVKKTNRMVTLCQTDISYWNAWESGNGPGQKVSKEVESDCPHLINSQCEIASEIAGIPCVPTPSICRACTNCLRSRRLNKYNLTMIMEFKPDIDISHIQSIIDNTSNGFGTRLSNTLGIAFSSKKCACPGRSDILDTWTPEYIKENMDKVIDWLKTEARNRGIPFSVTLTKLLLNTLLITQPKSSTPQITND